MLSDVALGERLQKDIYEALRAGPGWNRTMLLVTYDDAGDLLSVSFAQPINSIEADCTWGSSFE